MFKGSTKSGSVYRSRVIEITPKWNKRSSQKVRSILFDVPDDFIQVVVTVGTDKAAIDVHFDIDLRDILKLTRGQWLKEEIEARIENPRTDQLGG